MIIVGVSDEDEKLVTGFIKQFDVKFPIAISQNGGNRYGVSGYPTQFLIGADGTIQGSGHVDEGSILQALTKVDLPPALPDAPAFAALGKAWKSGRYAEVSRELGSLEQKSDLAEEHKKAVTSAREAFTKALTRAKDEILDLAKGPDYYASEQRLQALAKKFEGLPPAVDAQAQLKTLANDPKLQKEISAGKQLAALRKASDPSKSSGRKKLADGLRAFIEKNKGTKAAADAQRQLSELR